MVASTRVVDDASITEIMVDGKEVDGGIELMLTLLFNVHNAYP